MINIFSRLPNLMEPFRRHSKPGAAPGEFVSEPHAETPEIARITYSAEHFDEREITDVEELAQPIPAGCLAWINVEGFGDGVIVRRIAELFHLHLLAVEDVAQTHQRSKLEDYDDHLFIVARMAQSHNFLEFEQLGIFLGPNFVITFQEGLPGDCLEQLRERLRKSIGRIRQTGIDYLAYAIFDAVIDSYFPVIEYFGDRLEELDVEDLSGNIQELISKAHQLRSELMIVRRAIIPHRETVHELMRDVHSQVSDDTRIYLRDTHDHILQLIDVVETYREMCSDLCDYFFSQLNNRTNEIMKVLTIVATIFIPLSFIASLYGMNFSNMPELHMQYGYPLALALMLVVAGGLLAAIWRRGWMNL